MTFKRVISGVLSFCLTASALPLFELPSLAEGSSTELVEWNGYDTSNVNFDEWDGTYDTSWLNKYAGTEEDPYVIDSAEALMGLSQVTPVGKITEAGTPLRNITYASNIDLAKSGSYTAFYKNDLCYSSKGYNYSINPVVKLESINIESENSPKHIQTTDKTYDWYYITKVTANISVNGVIYPVDITGWMEEQCFLHDGTESLFEGYTDKTEFVTQNEFDAYMSYHRYKHNDAITLSDINFDISITANIDQQTVYLVADQEYSNSYGEGPNGTGNVTYPIGTFDDFGVEFPSVTATSVSNNSDVIEINNDNYDAFWLPAKNEYLSVAAIPQLKYLTESDTLKFSLADSSVSKWNYGTLSSATSLGTVEFDATTLKPANNTSYYMVWQDKNSSEEYIYDEEFYTTVLTSDAAASLTSNYTFSYRATANTFYIYVSEVLSDGTATTYTCSWPWSLGSYYYLRNLSADISLTNDGSLLIAPTVNMYSSNVSTQTKYKKSFSFETQSLQIKAYDLISVESIMLSDLTTAFVDSQGSEYDYSAINDNLKYVGYSTSYGFDTNLSPEMAWIPNLNLNLSLQNQDNIAENNTNDNPTFKNKYFIVNTDIKIEGNADSLFPMILNNTETGLLGTIDFDNHVLYWNPDKAVAPFGSIGEKGVLKNIVFVTDGNKSVYIGSDTNHLRNHMVDKNLGVILNATCMSIDAFNGDTPSSSNVTIGVASVNMGRMYDLTLIHTGACCINAGIISGVNVIVEDYSETNQTYSNDYFIGHYTTGYIEDVTVVAENGQSNVFLGVTYGGSGTFKNINYLNYTFTGTSANYMFYNYAGTIEDSTFELYMPNMRGSTYYMLYLYSNQYSSSYFNAMVLDNCNVYVSINTQFSLGYTYNSDAVWGLTILNSNIHLQLARTAGNTTYGLTAQYVSDSTITINVEDGNEPMWVNAHNTTINLSKYNSAYVGSLGELSNCTVNIGESYCYAMGNRVRDTVINIEKLEYNYTNGWSTYYFQPAGYLTYGIGNYWENVDYIVKEATGGSAAFSMINADNCRWSINYTGELKPLSPAITQSENRHFTNNEVYLTFDESCKGNIGNLGYFDSAVLKNNLFYIDSMPDNLFFGQGDVNTNGFLFAADDCTTIDGFTLIAPKLNIKTKCNQSQNSYYGSCADISLFDANRFNMPASNIYIYSNIYVPSDLSVNNIAAFYPETCESLLGSGLRDAYIEMNVFDLETKQPAEIATSAMYHYTGNAGILYMYNVAFRSNSLSPYSGLLTTQASCVADMYDSGRNGNIAFKNCYLDLYNLDLINLSEIDETSEGSQGGFLNVADLAYLFGEASNYSSEYVTGAALLTTWYKLSPNNVNYINCFVPTNQGATALTLSNTEYDIYDIAYNWEDIKTAWSNGDTSNELAEWAVHNYKVTSNYTYDYKSKLLKNDTTVEDLKKLATGVAYTNNEAIKTGELAYQLDNGASGDKRSYAWTVMEENVSLKNSITNEILWEIPATLTIADMYLPKRCVDGYYNLSPVFKTTVNDAEGGELEIAGIGGTATTDGSIYIKADEHPVTSVTTDSDEIMLIYALQKLGASRESVIPSTPLTRTFALRNTTGSYDISGYVQQSIDTVITPVFKTARYITVDIENDEHGTITPSVYVSAEGEKVTFVQNVEDGYIVSDIRVNGELVAGNMFYMPDENVTITGECIPFEGGITDFVLFGIPGEIDQTNKTIEITVPKSTYVSNALPEILYVGDYITPGVTARQDFTKPVEYTVTYGDNQTVTYIVTVHQSAYTMRIYDYVINGVHGNINQATKTITVTLPENTDLLSLKPDDIAYSAESITPTVEDELNFLVDQVYTLYTTDMTPVSYVVKVDTVDSDTAVINEFKMSGIYGHIDDDSNVITLNVPKSMDLTSIVPDNIDFTGKRITPSKINSVDLTDENTAYTVESQSTFARTYNFIINRIADDEAHIDKLVIAGIEGVINQDELTITFDVPFGTNLTGITPDEIIYTGKAIYPADDMEQDFTLPVQYTVVAGDNTEVTYDIIVNRLSNKANLIKFAILGFEGVINQDEKTVEVTIPYGIDITDTPPSELEISPNATVAPTILDNQNFTQPVVYTVTSQDKTVTNDYTVNVVIDYPDTTATIYEFYIDEYEAEIDQNNGIITVTLPYDYPQNTLKNKIPTIVWGGETLLPDENEAQDFTNIVKYTVTAEDVLITKDYNVVIKYKDSPYTPSKDAEITEFKIDEYEGEIDSDKGAITVTLPYDYPEEELKDKVPEIKWIGRDITPDDDKPQNFTGPVSYTVTAEDPSVSKEYDIIIKYEDKPTVPSVPEKDKEAKITEFKIDEYEGKIDDEKGIITVTLPYDYPKEELENKIPEIKWVGEDITPNEDAPQDFTKPVEYTVTAEDPSIKKSYDIVVEYEKPDTDAKIIEFYIDSYKGEIDQDKGIITVIIPYDYPDSELENKAPSIIWVGKDITPDEDEVQDFTEDVKYTVTAQDPSVKKEYDIVVKHADKPVAPVIPSIPSTPEKDKEAKIIEFYIDEHKAEIDQDKGIITITLPSDYPVEELKNKVPEIIWVGEDIDPDEDEAQDFTKSLEYTVTAEDPSIKKTYDIIVEFAPEQTPDVEETPDEDVPADEDDETPVEDNEDDEEDKDDEEEEDKDDNTPDEDDNIPDDDDNDEEEEEEDEDSPVPTGVVLNLIPLAVSAITVVITGRTGKKNKDGDR